TQCNTTNCLLSEGDVTLTLEDYLVGKVKNEEDIIYPVHFAEETKSKIKVIPASSYIDSHNITDNYKLKKLLDKLDNDFDYCLIDCTPYLAPMTLMGFCASRYVVTITELDTDSVMGYSLLIDEINSVKQQGYNETVELLGMVANKYMKNDKVGNYILDQFNQIAGSSMFDTKVRNARIMKQARFFGMPICYFQSSADICGDYKSLTKEIIKRIGDK
ncbi:MAG: AAA family ATPase, partial [Lachnospiraceae bacterium]|nr:AAA family ATPase [Lachnospiraceae bacterium]